MLDELQRVLNDEIPLTKALAVQVESFDSACLTVSAPLEPNINHKSTAFGGSLYSIGVLSGWGLVYLLLEKYGLQGHIVIQESKVEYLKPVAEKIVAKCCLPDERQLNQFVRMYQRKGRARLDLRSTIEAGGETALVFEGRYVVHA